ncbi:MAG: hypothetical protein ABR514_04675 [Chthoniobacterales bacterium]
MKARFKAERQSKRSDSLPARRCRFFPPIDHNYQQIGFGRYNGGHAGRSKASFLTISRDYFRAEARWSYIAEVFFFAMMVVTAASAVIYGVLVIIRLLGLPVTD